MALVADYSDSESSSCSSSDSETDSSEVDTKQSSPQKLSLLNEQKLPSAAELLTNIHKKAGEVFSNPFLEAENTKNARLEKHVKMVSKDEYLLQKNGRKICWNNRKGRCRFGSNCQYAHDSDLTLETNTVEPHTGSLENVSTAKPRENADKKKLKRNHPGLSNSIEPSKRIMKSYIQQQIQKQLN